MPAVFAEPEIVILEAPREVKTGGPGGGGPSDFEPGGNGWGGGDDDEFSRGGSKGPSAGMLGLLAMMVSITALFATIVIVFAVRAQTRSHWNAVALPRSLWISTLLIIASGATLQAARRAFAAFKADAYGKWLLGTFLLGLGFLLSQAWALRELVNQGIFLRQNPHSSLFYVITGVHGVHLMGGMLALFYLIYRVSRETDDHRSDFLSQRNLLSVTAAYWHFLDALWIALFLILLLWK